MRYSKYLEIKEEIFSYLMLQKCGSIAHSKQTNNQIADLIFFKVQKKEAVWMVDSNFSNFPLYQFEFFFPIIYNDSLEIRCTHGFVGHVSVFYV